jgi:hypothetical protein
MDYSVRRIDKKTANKIVSAKHYSHRLGIFWEGFGLYAPNLIGVVCYGQPSAPIQKHAFKNRDFRLYELTRLVVDSGTKNGASYLISHSLQMLTQQPSAVISYADSAQGHAGIVYQATNWKYTGAVKAHDSFYKVGEEVLHPMTVRDRFGINDPSRWAKENGIEVVKPQPKHRYFYFVGKKQEQKRMRSLLSYPIIDTYPKLDKKTYDDGSSCMSYMEQSDERSTGSTEVSSEDTTSPFDGEIDGQYIGDFN